MEPIERFAMWYPHNRVTNYYLGRAATVLKQKDRTELYLTLSIDQQKLFDDHRKYRLRSFLIKTDYLSTINWVFTDLRVNPYFPQPFKSGEKLVCECGRPLKNQFILQSVDGKKEIRLGVNHFADHLNLSMEVAREIQKGVNDVDVALDQLLLLKKQGQVFPEAHWQRYLFAFFQNVQLKEPVAFNQKLLSRIYAFKKVNMPIYLADYQLISDEIKQVNFQVRAETETRFIIDQKLFEVFVSDVEEDLEGLSVFIKKGFFQKKLTPFTTRKFYTKEDKELAFQKLLEELRKNNAHNLENPFLEQNILRWLQDKFNQHKWTPNFFFILPRSLRNGLLKARRYEINGRKEVLENIFLTTLDAYILHWIKLAQDPIVREDPVLFETITELLFPSEKTGIQANLILKAFDDSAKNQSFDQAFSAFPQTFQDGIKKYF